VSPSSVEQRALIPRLTPRAWTIVGGGAVASTSYGFVTAFLMLYLHYVRGMSLGTAGLALSGTAIGAVVSAPFVGWATDRYGPRLVLVAASVVAAVGIALLAVVHSPWQAMAATLVFGLGDVAIMTPEATLLATAVPGEQRSAAFTMQYTGMSVGWSFGALLGGWTVNLARPGTFFVAFLVAALPYLAFAGIVACLPRHSPFGDDEEDTETMVHGPGVEGGPTTALVDDTSTPRPRQRAWGFRRVLGDRLLLQILSYFLVVIAFAGVQLDATFPSYAVGVGHMGTRLVGLAFAANTLVIVATQLFVLRGLAGHRRSRALAVGSLVCSLSWVIVLLSGQLGGGIWSALGFVTAMVVFGLAETTWSPCLSPMVNDIAPPGLRGRYNSMMGAVEGCGRIIGPVFAGFLLAAGLGDALVALLAVVTAGGALLALRLERQVPRAANVVGEAPASSA